MKVFISWSGPRSQALAIALGEWIKNVLDFVEPWVSDKDIAAGDRWAQEVAKELDASNFGIVCVTPENLESQWVSFEAGALAKSMQDAKVIPLLFDLELSDLTGPLSQFQAKKVDKEGLCEVIQAINKSADKDVKTSDERAIMLSEALWSNFETALEDVPDVKAIDKPARKQADILEELVEGIRGIDGRVREFDMELSGSNRKNPFRGQHRFHPAMIDDLFFMSSEGGDDAIALLMIAGLLRDSLPWLSEVLIETYRKIDSGNSEEAARAVKSLHRVLKHSRKGMMMDMVGSKEQHMMLMELPHMLERALNRLPNHASEIDPDLDDILG